MVLSDHIARLIEEMLEEGNGQAEVRRNDLAARIGCVPSQINYVITSRFTPERGYVTESRRGGGGYIRISRVRIAPSQLLMHTVNAIGAELDFRTAEALLANAVAGSALTPAAAKLMRAAVSDSALRSAPPELRNTLRAGILKQMLVSVN